MKHISQIARESKIDDFVFSPQENKCFVCGEPFCLDDFRYNNAGTLGAHLKCYEEFNREQDDKYLDSMITKYGRENLK